MPVVHDAHNVVIRHGDSLHELTDLADGSVDTIITDPPYGLRDLPTSLFTETLTRWTSGDRAYVPKGKGFMGRDWDEFVPPPALWDECFRVLKPGGHMVAFAGSRTYDLMGTSIRMSGFEIRDGLAWLHSQGFAKNHDVSMAIDRTLGMERPVIGRKDPHDPRTAMARSMYGTSMQETPGGGIPITAPASAEATRWDGWGTALKPAHEPIVLARKPLEGTVAANVLAHGTGGVNVDACRVEHANEADRAESEGKNKHARYGTEPGQNNVYGDYSMVDRKDYDGSRGRWPTNVLLTHTPGCDGQEEVCTPGCVVAELDAQSGVSTSRVGKPRTGTSGQDKADSGWGISAGGTEYNDTGGASRFFPSFRYEGKARTGWERPVGMDQDTGEVVRHDTVKPVELMRWLVRLLTPPGGVVLDPFAGSGTTGEACLLEGVPCVLVEREGKYLQLIEQRVNRLRDPVAWVAQVEPSDAGGGTLFDVLTGLGGAVPADELGESVEGVA